MSRTARAALTTVMDHDQITTRLRRLGEAPIPGDVADAHLGAIAGVRPQRRLGRVGLIAAAAVAVLALATVPTGLIGSSDGDHTDLATDVQEADEANEAAGPPEGRGPCQGPPPWAGSPPVGDTEEARAAHRAEQRAEWRAQRAAGSCPEGEGREGRGRPGWAGPPEGRGPCQGPPPWAGSPPEGDTEEARAEARARDVAEWRAERQAAGCPTDDEPDD